ncbi:MAG TPA: hypothetical protein VF169_06600 [Albitalea sp.]|uniref:hypothetical protein n=1 Tax=Piscinibacter sp. TaxID=1903157 RepID=UPI002ED32070
MKTTWRWIAIAMTAFALLTLLAIVGWAWTFEPPPVHVVIDGDEVFGIDLGLLTAGDKALLVGGVLLAVLAVIVVVPVALIIALAATLFGVAVGVGLPLLMVVLVGALVLSPLWLLAAGVWWLLRRGATRPARATPPANIAA